jgi:hypothetical protein
MRQVVELQNWQLVISLELFRRKLIKKQLHISVVSVYSVHCTGTVYRFALIFINHFKICLCCLSQAEVDAGEESEFLKFLTCTGNRRNSRY